MTTRPTSLLTHWPWIRRSEQLPTVSADRSAERIESYVYGNVLVLAALATVGLDDLDSSRPALLILGTAFSTYVAHLLSVTVAHRARTDHPLRHAFRDGVPIATSGLVPAGLLLLGWAGVLAPRWSLGLAIATIVFRFVLTGSVVSHLNGEQSTWKNALIGFGLALAGLVVAAVKFLLTH